MLSILRRIAEDDKPDYFAVVFDAPEKRSATTGIRTRRSAADADDLVRQIAPLHELVRANGWPLLMIEGVEADDVISTLARMASRRNRLRDLDSDRISRNSRAPA